MISQKNGWAALILPALALLLVAPRTVLAVEGTCVVKVAKANIRSGPGTGYPAIHAVEEGDRLTVIEESGDWRRVRLPRDGPAWIYKEMVTLEEDRTGGPTSEGTP